MTDLAPPPPAPVQARAEPPWRAPVTLGAAAVAGTALLAVTDPTTTHVPLCPLNAVTGLDCPLCGGLRAVHSLTRADLGAALDHNVLFTVSVPALVLVWAVWLARSLGRPVAPGRHLPAWTTTVVVVVLVVFGVLRNLPGLGWLGSGA